MSKLTHPADGLYYLTLRRIKELYPCAEHLRAWIRRHGRNLDKQVPVTYADMVKQEKGRDTNACIWLLRQMHEAGRITWEEYYRFSWGVRHPSHGRVPALMDALLSRAKREGKIQ